MIEGQECKSGKCESFDWNGKSANDDNGNTYANCVPDKGGNTVSICLSNSNMSCQTVQSVQVKCTGKATFTFPNHTYIFDCYFQQPSCK
jgi:hypothetical protein